MVTQVISYELSILVVFGTIGLLKSSIQQVDSLTSPGPIKVSTLSIHNCLLITLGRISA